MYNILYLLYISIFFNIYLFIYGENKYNDCDELKGQIDELVKTISDLSQSPCNK